jgi:hypothetical protein
MAPEQAGGKAAAGPASDIYALGAILYELLAGRPPFQAATPLDTIMQVLELEPVRPRAYNRQVDPSLEAICLKCLEKSPRDRYASAEDLAEDLRAYLQGAPVLADGSASVRVLRLLLRESRHAEVLTHWGRVWLWHAAQVFLLFLATNVLLWSDVARAWPYVALWGVGLASLGVPIWHYRFRSGLRLTPVERQLGQVWGLFALAAVLTGAINHLMGDGGVEAVTAGGPGVWLRLRVHGGDPGRIVLRDGPGLRRAGAGDGARAAGRAGRFRRGVRHRSLPARVAVRAPGEGVAGDARTRPIDPVTAALARRWAGHAGDDDQGPATWPRPASRVCGDRRVMTDV